MKKIFTYIGLFVFCCSCSDEAIESPTADANIVTHQYQSSFFFAGLPVQFDVHTQTSVSVDEWWFGDLHTSTIINPWHTFDFPGTYRVSVLLNNRHASKDTTITISPPLRLIGSKLAAENGEFIFERNAGGYTVIHTWNQNSSAEEWRLLSASETFDSLSSKTVGLSFYESIPSAILNKAGNIVGITSEHRLVQTTFGRPSVSFIQGLTGWLPIKIDDAPDEYLISGWGFGGGLNIGHFNREFQMTSLTTLDVQRPGFQVSSYFVEPEGSLRLHYYEGSSLGAPRMTFVKIDPEGTILFEQTYPFEVAATESFKLNSGYMLYGKAYRQFSFTRVDESGKIEWTVRSPDDGFDQISNHLAGYTFIEDGSSVIIFFGAQQVMKVNGSGQVEWSKRFGTINDTFNAAVRNSKGNIVFLGTHQFDYTKNEYTSQAQYRDLVLFEIDTNGNRVFK